MADAQLTFSQKSYSTRTSLTLGPEQFTYTFRQGRNRDEITADYFQIARGETQVTHDERSAVPHALLVLICGAAFIALDLSRGAANPLTALWIVPGLISLALVLALKTRFTALKVADDALLLIQDKQHAAILEELASRRRQRLRTLYAPLNLSTDPDTETRKIEWLVEEGALSREEADNQLAQIAHATQSRAAARAAATKQRLAEQAARLGS